MISNFIVWNGYGLQADTLKGLSKQIADFYADNKIPLNVEGKLDDVFVVTNGDNQERYLSQRGQRIFWHRIIGLCDELLTIEQEDKDYENRI